MKTRNLFNAALPIVCGLTVLMTTLTYSQSSFAVSGVSNCDKVLWASRKPVKWRSTPTFFVSNEIWNNMQFRGELQAAVARWNEASGNINIRIQREQGSAMNFGNRVNEIYMAPIAGSTIADARTSWGSPKLDNGRCYYREADIRFDTNVRWDNTAEFGDFNGPLNIGLVAIHEFGHILGQQHDNNRQRSMNSAYPNGGPIGRNHEEAPFAADRRKLREVYSTGSVPIDIAASRWIRNPRDPSSADPIDLLRGDRSTPTNGTVSRGQYIFFPYSIHNFSGSTQDLQVRFYMSNDRIMGNSGDVYLGLSWYTLPGGTDLSGDKYIRIPSSRRGFQYFGYNVVPVNGESSSRRINNNVSLMRNYWVN